MEKKLQLKKRTILVLNEEQTSEVAGGEIPNPRPTYDNADRCIGGTEGYCPPTEPPADLCPSDPGQSCDCGGPGSQVSCAATCPATCDGYSCAGTCPRSCEHTCNNYGC